MAPSAEETSGIEGRADQDRGKADVDRGWDEDQPRVSGVEPLTLSLLGRFFGVPLLIIGTIVGGAVVVVLFFAGPAAPPPRTIEQLLQELEANSGNRSLGVLLPREKELWQTALELSQRLDNKNNELSAEELEVAAQRLGAMVTSEINANPPAGVAIDQNQRSLRSARLEFLIRALGRTRAASARQPLLELVQSGAEPHVGIAMQVLGDDASLRGDREVIDAIREATQKAKTATTLITGCTVLSVLAGPGNGEVLDTLAEVRLLHEGEVDWSAALALARLGDARGKSTLMDLLDRPFLESPDRYVAIDEAGNVKGRYPLPPARVEALLVATIDAASHLNDGDLWEMVGRLQSDRSLAVRGKASEAMARRGERSAKAPNEGS